MLDEGLGDDGKTAGRGRPKTGDSSRPMLDESYDGNRTDTTVAETVGRGRKTNPALNSVQGWGDRGKTPYHSPIGDTLPAFGPRARGRFVSQICDTLAAMPSARARVDGSDSVPATLPEQKGETRTKGADPPARPTLDERAGVDTRQTRARIRARV